MSIDEIMALADEYVSASIEAHGYRSGAASAEYLEDTKRKLLAALESLIAAPAAPQRNREADRARYTDPAFNEWLDDSVADGGATVWDLVPDVHSAWFAWTAHPNYAAPQQAAHNAREINNLVGKTDSQQAGPVWMRPDQLQKARHAPFLCRVSPTKDAPDLMPMFLHPPAAEVQRLREALEYLIEKCGDSDDAQYSTLGTKFVRDIARRALEGE